MKRIALAILTAGVFSAHANLITNGSFEDNGSNLQTNYGNWQIYSSIIGWSNTGVVEVQDNGLYGSASVAANGSYWLEMDSYASYSITTQSFAAVAGQTYTVTFDYAGRPDAPAYDDVLDVVLNGVETTYSTTPSAPGGPLNWTTASLTFTSTGSDYVTFGDGGPSDSYGMLLDNVDVEAVPEPTTLGLFGIGLLAMVGFARFRNKREA